MDGVPDFETIDVELDEFLKKKQTSRCRDRFLNSLCDDTEEFEELSVDEEQVEEAAEVRKPRLVVEENSVDDEDELDVEYPIHDPTVKWNKMRPIFGEMYESPQ